MSRFPTCQVCQQHFSLNGPAPFLFPCLHAVCETCVTSADGGVLVCIPCQREVNLTETNLQKDVITEKEILHLTLNHNPELVLCTHEDDGNQAVCWCGDCQHFFCENCQMIHNSFRGSRSHTVQNIGELKTGSFNQDKYCSIHPKFIADTWDKDCCMLTCATCRRKDHVKHRVIYLDETADCERKEMEILQNNFTETINEQEAHRTATEQDLSSSEQAYDVLPDTITHTFNSLKTLIDQREKEMQIELQQHRDKVLGDLRSKKNTSETSLRRYQTTCDYINKTLQYGSLHDFLELRPELELKSMDCRRSSQSKEYKSHPLPVFKTEGLEKIRSTLAQFGTIAKEFDEIEGGSESSFNTSTASGFKNISQAGSPRKGVEGFEPNVYFKPVIDLPDLVELKTGEEDEEKVFGERAKLFRFDTNSSQWKERGVGEMKIFFNKDTRKYRILMRRDQVLKICANHNISKEMKLTPIVRSDRAWCWSAMDFADEEMNMEKLAVKFKSPELAIKFKDCFETCQKKMETQSKPEAIGSTEVAEKQDNKDMSLSKMFKQKAGSWECPTCCCQNEGDKLKCPACNTVKPGAEDEVKKAELANMPAPGSMAGFKIGGGSGFKTGGDTSFGFGVGSRAGAGAGAGGFSFGSPSGGSGGFSFMQKQAQDKPQYNKVSSSVPEVEAKETSKDYIKGTSKETPKDTPKGPHKSLAEMFKPKEGAWECPGCMCNNDATHVKCPACKTVKPGAKPEDIKSEAAATAPPSLAGFKVGGGAGGFSFASKPSTSATPTKEEKKPAATGATKSLLAEMLQTKDTPEKTIASAHSSGFSFTPKSGLNFGAATTPQKSGGFNFGTPAEAEKKETASSGFNFGTPAADSTKKEGFQFNLGKASTPFKATEGAKTDTSNFQFTFSLTPSKSPQAKSPQVPKSPDDCYYVNKEDDDSHIYFEPIISLPEKVDLKTGEEEEICHFEQRAKLFRFHDKEWKERGLGTMKILEHKETHRRRLLMRREQILKICCNHIINPELELKPVTTGGECKAWVWFAQDFADVEPKMENFAIRFKTKEIADQFKKEFDAAKALAAGSEPKSEAATESAAGAVSKKTSENEDLSGVEYLFSEEATEEQKAEIRRNDESSPLVN